MSKFKKLVAGITATAVVATQALSAVVYGAATTTDPEFEKALAWMYENGMTKYNTADAFRPNDTLTRQEAAIFYSEFAVKILGAKASDSQPSFTDMDTADASLKDSIILSYQLGLFKGTNGKFYPTAPLTKAASLSVLVRAMAGMMDENVTPWWKNYFQKARELGLTKETDVNALDRPVTRYEIALMLYRASGEQVSADDDDDSSIGDLLGDLLGDDDDDAADDDAADDDAADDDAADDDAAADDDDDDDVSNVEGQVLEIALDPDTPRNQYVPGTGSQIRVMKFDLMAGSEDVELSAITVKLEGLANKTNIQNVYVVDGDGKILTNQRQFNSSYEARLVFDGKYVVSANKVAKLYLAMDVAGSSSEIFTFSIPSAEAVESNVTVNGDFPIISYSTQTTSYSSEIIRFEGEQTSSSVSASGKLYVGDTNKRIMRFTLESTNVNGRNTTLKSMTFRGINDLENIIDNVQLIVNGENVAKEVIIDGKNVTIVTDFEIAYGQSRTFYVYADVVGGEDRDDIQLYLNKTSDIAAIEAETNAATSIEIKNSKKYGNLYDLQEGDNLISKASDSPTSQNVPTDSNDILALKSTVYISNPMSVEKIRVYLTGYSSGGVANLSSVVEKVKLYVNDRFVDESSSFLTDSAGETYCEMSYYDNLEGTSAFVVKFDTTNNSNITDSTVRSVSIYPKSIIFDSNAEYVNTSNTINSTTEIKGSASSSTFTVKRPSVQSISKNDGLSSNETVVSGVEDYQVLKFAVQNSNVRALLMNGFTVTYSGTNSTGTTAYSFLSNMKVLVGGQEVGIDNFGSQSVTFSSLGITIPNGGSVDVSLLVDIGAGYPDAGAFQLLVNAWDIEDDAGNDITAPTTTITSANFTVSAGGILYVDRDTNTPSEKVLAANNSIEQEVTRLKFKSTKDDSLIQTLTLANVGTGTPSGGYVKSGNIASVLSGYSDNVVAKVYAYDTNGTKLGEGDLVNGFVTFNFSESVTLSRDAEYTMIFKVKANQINNTNLTNQPVNFALWIVGSANQYNSKETKIVSKSNGSEVPSVTYGTAVYGYPQIFRATNIVLSDVSQTNTTSLDGIPTFYSFKSTVDAAKSAKVKEFRFDFDVTDNTADGAGFNVNNFELYADSTYKFSSSDVEFYGVAGTCSANIGSAITTQSPTFTGGTNTSTSYCLKVVLTGAFINGYDISSSSSKTWMLKAKSNSVTKNDSVSVRMNEVSSNKSILDYTSVQATSTSLVWSDNAADNVILGTSDWYTDAYIELLPLSAWTVTKP